MIDPLTIPEVEYKINKYITITNVRKFIASHQEFSKQPSKAYDPYRERLNNFIKYHLKNIVK